MKINWKSIALIAILSSVTTLTAYHFLGLGKKEVVFESSPSAFNTRFTSGALPAGNPGDFTYAAEKTLPAVVHIKSTAVRQVRQQQQMFDLFDLFGGDGGMDRRQQKQQSSGSGVIISGDGYIVTNNHVVAGAEEVDVILNDKREYKAKVIGADPNTDIAVIQIKATNLPFLNFGDSDGIRVGEWVLAVGNPFNLESTVTAGIVSAKGRGIGILEGDNPIESFIQTDAAVNPGNSGGALVNLKGELVGINTAIAGGASGTYVGYSFAVPVAIVKKVSADLLKYGNVQRGFLGVTKMQELNNKLVEELDLKVGKGVYVGGFSDQNSSAKTAGIKVGDVITKVDGIEVANINRLVETVGRHRPGDVVVVTVNRDGQLKDFNVTLKNRDGNTNIVKSEESAALNLESLGAKFGDLSDKEKRQLNLSGGAKVLGLEDGGRLQDLGIGEGFVITKIGDQAVRSAKDLSEILQNKKGRVRLEGTYIEEPGSKYYFEFYK